MADYKSLHDITLLQLLKESDHSAYNEIYHRYFYLIFTHAYKKLRDGDQAKDIVQDLFTTLWYKRESDLHIENLSAYLYTAIRNRIFDLFAHEQVKAEYVRAFNAYRDSQTSPPADYLVRENNLRSYIEKEIQALPPKMRRVFEMSRKENLSHKEIAQALGVSENNVSKQVNNALRILRTRLGIIAYLYFLIRF